MPKTKKEETDSSSDSGPDDKTPVVKKAKIEKKEGDSEGKTDKDGNTYYELDRNRRVTMSKFKGKEYLNIREFYTDKAGEAKPGKSGITLTKKEWEQLLALQPKLKFEG